MYGEMYNLWSEDTDENIVRSWLVGVTGGQTFSINQHFLPRVKSPLLYGNFHRIEAIWDGIIGDCYRYKLDDPRLEPRVRQVVDGINGFIERLNANPEEYLTPVSPARATLAEG